MNLRWQVHVFGVAVSSAAWGWQAPRRASLLVRGAIPKAFGLEAATQSSRQLTGRGPRNRAFTLIELLVVLAIIAVLMAILLSALQGARKQAQDIKRRADLRQHDIVQRMDDGDTGRDLERSKKKRRSR